MSKVRSIINHDILKRLLLLSKKITEGQNQYEDVLGVRLPLVSDIWEELYKVIFDYIGIPQDTSMCFINDGVNKKEYDANDEKCKQCTGCFCRDYWIDVLFEFGNGKTTLEETIEELVNWDRENED